MNTQDEDRLRAALRSQAGRAETRPLDLRAVTGRARRIRRRRTTLAALSTAAVVALAVPAGLALTGNLDRDGEPPVAGQTPDSSVAPPARLLEVSLLEDARTGGEAPSLAYLRGGEIVTPEGSVAVPGEGRPSGVALLGDHWMVLMDRGDGLYTLDTVSASGRLLRTAPAQAGPVLSDDGTVAAYVSRDGDIHGVTADGVGLLFDLSGQAGDAAEIAAVLGSGDCQASPGCTVLVNAGEGGVRAIGPDGQVEPVTGFSSLADASGTKTLGTVSVSDDGSCSALRDGSAEVWRTCDNSFGRMSPDERYAIGHPPYLSGMGPKSVSIVDMADGRELVRFADEGRTDTYVRQAVWESDTSLLMTVWDGEERSWNLLRAGLDGSLTEVETGLRGGDMDPPVALPVR